MTTDPLRLVSVRLENFGCFADSSEVPIDDVTVLLAENENGKTTFLRAIEWFGSSADFDDEDRYAGAAAGEQSSVSLTFELHEAAGQALTTGGFPTLERVRVCRDDAGLF